MRLKATLAALLAVAAFCLLSGPAAASPLDGRGSWIWYVSATWRDAFGASPGPLPSTTSTSSTSRAPTAAIRWSQFTPQLVKALHKRKIDICAWPFVYGNDPKREAKVTAKAAALGADCIVVDAEASYEGRYKQAYIYMKKLRKLVGADYPIGLSSFPYTDYHPTFPYSVFLGKGGADFNVPQIYWHAIGDSVRSAFKHTYRWNIAYDRPIFPVGQTYSDPRKRELLDFRRYANEFGAPGHSWWSWQETNKKEWKVVGRRNVKGVPGFEAKRRYPVLARGADGDMVLLAQELLAAWELQPKPTGAFDKRTLRAVEEFQLERGLEVSGKLDNDTWRELVKRGPESTNWKRQKVPKTLGRRAPRGSAGAGGAEFTPPPKGSDPERVADPGAGPVGLKRVGVGQSKLTGSIRFTVANPLPPLHALKLYPSRLGSDERHLCLVADGKAIRKRAICVGGQAKKGRVRLGISRYRKGGGLKKVHGATARLKRISANAIRLEFPLRSADFAPGRFRYRAESAWSGPECGDGQTAGVCHSRVPAGKSAKGKINKVERVGCTPGVKGFALRGPTDRKRVALTFDDGPSIYTDDILRILDHEHVNGTFFEIGSQTGGVYSDVMRKIVEHGNELADHSYRHETLPGRSSMAATNKRIRDVTGFEPCHFRPPGGAYNSGTVSTARSLGMGTVNWDVDTRDWDGPPSASTIRSRAVGGGRGSIVLMHDGGGNRSQTVAALPDIIRTYKKRGYEIVTVTELLGGHFKLREKH